MFTCQGCQPTDDVLRSGFVPAITPPALHFFRRQLPTEAIIESGGIKKTPLYASGLT
jgi:hypothetical protein